MFDNCRDDKSTLGGRRVIAPLLLERLFGQTLERSGHLVDDAIGACQGLGLVELSRIGHREPHLAVLVLP